MLRYFRTAVLALAVALIFAIPSFSLANEGSNDFKRPTHEEIQKEVSDINAAIKAKGAKWVAGETSMARLSRAERKMRLGILAVPLPKGRRMPAPKLFLDSAGSGGTTAPSPYGTLDWRNYNGGNYVTGVRDQEQCGDCWAFASVAGLESKTLITMNTPGVNLDLSEQVLNSCDTADNIGDGCNGGNLVTDFFVNTGAPLESCDPYTATDGNCANACANWQQSAYKTSSYTWIVPYGSQQTVDVLKNGLNTYGPLVVTFAVYADLYSYTSGIYTHTSGALDGYHAVLLVGCDNTNNCFIVKNSWGTSWGESGYFRIAYSEVSDVCDFGYEALAYNGATPPGINSTITYPVNGGAVSGTSCTITGTAEPYTLTKVEVSTDGGTTWNIATDTSGAGTWANWSYNWTLPAEGTYLLKSRATDSRGKAETPGAGVTVTVDKSPPSSAVTAPANGAFISGTRNYAITGTASDSLSSVGKVEVSADGGSTWNLASDASGAGTWATWSYNWSLADGSFTIKSRATDRAGNVETPGTGVSVNADVPPVINAGPNKIIKSQSTLVATATDASPMTYSWSKVSGPGNITFGSPASLSTAVSADTDGTYTLRFTATETSGLTAYSDMTLIWDTSAPSSTITAPINSGTLTGVSCWIKGTAADSGGAGFNKVEVSTDGGTTWRLATGTTSWSYSWTLPADGNYTIQSRATNDAGSVESPGAGITIKVANNGLIKQVWTWGYNSFGELGNGSADSSLHLTPIVVNNLNNVIAACCKEIDSLALTSDGTVWAWGYNDYGQLGNGTTTGSYVPVQVMLSNGVTPLSGVVAIAGDDAPVAGMTGLDAQTVALKSDGTVWAWGSNSHGEIGNGTSGSFYPNPVQVVGPSGSGYLTGVAALACGYAYDVALKSDGTVWAWGWNAEGQLGIGAFDSNPHPVPAQVLGPNGSGYLTGVVAIGAGSNSTIALKSDGTVWTWGYWVLEQGFPTWQWAKSSTPIQVMLSDGVHRLAELSQ